MTHAWLVLLLAEVAALTAYQVWPKFAASRRQPPGPTVKGLPTLHGPGRATTTRGRRC